MFQKDDYILYRTTGICKIENIGIPSDFSVSEDGALYYYLAPVRGSGIVYVPTTSTVFMRPVISRSEAEQLLDSISSITEEPLFSRDPKALTAYYKDLLQQHDCTALIRLIKGVYRKASMLAEQGKTLGKIDTQYRKQAEDLLEQELSIALNIPYEEISSYVTNYIHNA